MSEIGKGASGLVGFPTPNNAADVEAYLLFLFPDPEWAQYILGAAKNLTVPYNWYEAGDMLPADAAEAFRLIVEQAPYNLRDATVNAPFWDEESGDDTDDIEPRDEQEWYGQWDGETFIESLAYVFLTNFLSKLITTQGAIKYLAIPRTFRLLIKQNPHGAKLLLFLDGGLYAVVNGYSIVDQVLEVVVKALPSGALRAESDSPVELMIVHSGEHDPDATPDENGNYTVDVIRGRLSEQDVLPPNIRYNPDTDTVQFSPDGGTTWNNAEGQDPRRAPAFLMPPRTGTDRRCDSAANMVSWVRNFIDEIIADLTGIGTAGLVVSTALNAWSLLFEPIAIIDLIANVAATIGEVGSSLLEASFTDETYGLLLCIFYCRADADGQISPEKFVLVQSDVAEQLNTTASIVMALILGAQGEVGLSNAGTLGAETGDCNECTCEWCYQFTAASGLEHWDIMEWSPGQPLATWDGTSWHSACFTSGNQVAYIHLRKVLPEPVIVIDAGILNLENSCTGSGQGIWINGDGSIFSGTQVWAAGGSYTGGDVEVSSIDILVFCVNAGCPDINFDGLQFSGFGDNPFGENNC